MRVIRLSLLFADRPTRGVQHEEARSRDHQLDACQMTDSTSKPLKFPRIDLPRSNVMRMFITANCEWTAESTEVMRDILGGGNFFVSGTPYTANGKQHLITDSVSYIEEQSPRSLIRIDYDATDYPDSVTVPRGDQREREFLTHVLRLRDTFDLWCNIEFHFLEAENSELWFPLPSRIGSTTDATETFEIVGVNAIKLPGESDGDMGYTFRLDLSPSGEVFLDLYFPFSRAFTLDLPKQVLNEGLSIARRLVGGRTVRRRAAK